VKQVLVRTTAGTAQAAADVSAIARDLDPAALMGEVAVMVDVVARESAPWRFAMRVLSAFGVLAAVLATVGLAGLVSLVVALRRRDLGIRAALGATPRRLCSHVLAETVWTASAAAVVGVLGALALGRLVAGLLVETPAHDPTSIGGAALLTLVAGVAASLWPAMRAAHLNAVEALRE
jgi:putative ABC transport system permease protein